MQAAENPDRAPGYRISALSLEGERTVESLLEDKSRRIEPGLVIDFGRGGQPIGIEVTTPQKLSLAALNRVLRQFGFAPVKRAELATVLAA